MRHFFALVLIGSLIACGGGSGSPTSTPTAVPSAPATPVPTPTPNPFAAACGTPLPPFEFSYGFGIKVQLEPSGRKKVLNTSPAIRNYDYCLAAGFGVTLICNTRKEDDPQREACDHYISGISDQGRPGPNWFQDMDGRLVKCGDPGTTCALKPENQYLLDIYDVGRYVACGGTGSPGTCGDCIIQTMERSPSGNTGGLCKHQ
jgi:hypothetical protein